MHDVNMYKGMKRLLLFSLLAIFVSMQMNLAYGHFFGSTMNIDNYQVVFSPYPSGPVAGDNSTRLNFSVLDNNTNNLYNTYSAVVIKEKQSGNITDQVPYKLYEFSDISIQYTFPHPGDYVVTLQTRIQDDPKYQASPLVADFPITALDPHQVIPFDELMLFYVTPAAAVIAGLAVYLHSKKKL
jgi:hypothetical protein